MRILHLCKYYPPFAGGMETFVGALLDEMQRKGVETIALAHDHKRGRGLIKENSPLGTKILRVPTMGRFLYAPLSPRFPEILREIVVETQPDLIHMHLPNTSAFWALCQNELKKIPWILHWHADVVASKLDRRLRYAYPLYRPFEQALLRRSSAVIVTSPPYLEASEPLKQWREKCRIIPLGLEVSSDSEAFHEDVSNVSGAWKDSCFRILCVGRLTYYKGHEVLVQAVKGIPGARLLLVGDGEQRSDLQRKINEVGVRDQVGELGYRSESEVKELLRTCDVFCLPSIERTEAFGMVILEAMSYAKPVVISAVPGAGMGWVVVDGKTGLHCEPGDVKGLHDSLQKLRAAPEWAKTLGAAGRERFRAYFNIAGVADDIIHLSKTLLKS